MTTGFDQRRTAEQAMIAICAHLSLSVTRDENLTVWLDVLRDLTVACRNGSPTVEAVRAAAEDAAFAPGGHDRTNALTRLRSAVRKYFIHSAAARVEDWQRIRPGRSRR